MTLESRIEARACKELERIKCYCVKIGFAGWPDRLICYAPTKVLWFEFKQPKSRLGPKQKIRFEELEQIGHKPYVVTSVEQAVEIVKTERRAIGFPEEGR